MSSIPQGLPLGWLCRHTPDGRPYYVNTIDEVEQQPTWIYPTQEQQQQLQQQQQQQHHPHQPDQPLDLNLDAEMDMSTDNFNKNLNELNHLAPFQEQYDLLFQDLIGHPEMPTHTSQVLGHLHRHSSVKLFSPSMDQEFDFTQFETDVMDVDMPHPMRRSLAELMKRGSFAEVLAMLQNEVHTTQPEGIHPEQKASFGHLIDMLHAPADPVTYVPGMPSHLEEKTKLTHIETRELEQNLVNTIVWDHTVQSQLQL